MNAATFAGFFGAADVFGVSATDGRGTGGKGNGADSHDTSPFEVGA
jgi:hypothetical protein